MNIDEYENLVEQIIAGDPQSEEVLVSQFSRGIRFYLKRMVSDSELLEDLFQDTFVIALKKIRNGDVREPKKLKYFLKGVAHNNAIDVIRRKKRDNHIQDQNLDGHSSSGPNPATKLLKEERRNEVRRLLDELSSNRDREVLFRFYIEQDDKKDICVDLGLTSTHFNRVLYRAKQRFKEIYEKWLRRVQEERKKNGSNDREASDE